MIILFAARTAPAMRAALTTLAARTTRTLGVAFRLLLKHTMRQLVLAGLRVYLKEFHLDVVAFVNACFLDGLQALPRYLGDMEQSFPSWENLYEASVRHNALYHTVIYLSYLRNGNDGADLGNGSIDACLIRSTDLHLSYAISLIDGDSSVGLIMNLLDNLYARTND